MPSSNEAGSSVSTPKGRSPTWSWIQRICSRASSGSSGLMPSTPIAPALLAAATTSFVSAKATIGISQPYSSQSRVRSGSGV